MRAGTASYPAFPLPAETAEGPVSPAHQDGSDRFPGIEANPFARIGGMPYPAAMTDSEAIESFALQSAFTWPSILELRPKTPRIARQMHERGVKVIPSHPWTADWQASNLLTLTLLLR